MINDQHDLMFSLGVPPSYVDERHSPISAVSMLISLLQGRDLEMFREVSSRRRPSCF
jgi:hypothetical protein